MKWLSRHLKYAFPDDGPGRPYECQRGEFSQPRGAKQGLYRAGKGNLNPGK